MPPALDARGRRPVRPPSARHWFQITVVLKIYSFVIFVLSYCLLLCHRCHAETDWSAMRRSFLT